METLPTQQQQEFQQEQEFHAKIMQDMMSLFQ
jgi:hypothetical protein